MGNATDLASRLAGTAAPGRENLWARIVRDAGARTVMEVGVWKGDFATHLLKRCPEIERYYMIDPWRHLDVWNKPWNLDQASFDAIHAEALAKTAFARDRRVVLRGTTTEVIGRVPDQALDIAYIDGDHTLRGIAIDLICVYPKIRPGGIIGGDDYTPSIWQHPREYEPTLVCPFAAYFAESQGAPLVILPYCQFAIVKPAEPGRHFQVIDTTGRYGERSLRAQLRDAGVAGRSPHEGRDVAASEP